MSCNERGHQIGCPFPFALLTSKEDGLQLDTQQGSVYCIGNTGKIGDQLRGLVYGIVLSEGNKIMVFLHEQSADVFGCSGKAVIG